MRGSGSGMGSLFGSIVTIALLFCSTAFAQVTNYTKTGKEVVVMWDPVTQRESGAAITIPPAKEFYYRVYYWKDGNTTKSTRKVSGATQSKFSFLDYTLIHFYVVSVLVEGDGTMRTSKPSNEITVTFKAPDLPGYPKNIRPQ